MITTVDRYTPAAARPVISGANCGISWDFTPTWTWPMTSCSPWVAAASS